MLLGRVVVIGTDVVLGIAAWYSRAVILYLDSRALACEMGSVREKTVAMSSCRDIGHGKVKLRNILLSYRVHGKASVPNEVFLKNDQFATSYGDTVRDTLLEEFSHGCPVLCRKGQCGGKQ